MCAGLVFLLEEVFEVCRVELGWCFHSVRSWVVADRSMGQADRSIALRKRSMPHVNRSIMLCNRPIHHVNRS